MSCNYCVHGRFLMTGFAGGDDVVWLVRWAGLHDALHLMQDRFGSRWICFAHRAVMELTAGLWS
ncbi:hypothetical protein BJY00DRAFT_274836, partial [Aspergillus carlsbadensis]